LTDHLVDQLYLPSINDVPKVVSLAQLVRLGSVWLCMINDQMPNAVLFLFKNMVYYINRSHFHNHTSNS
jgi:hypothetical protein